MKRREQKGHLEPKSARLARRAFLKAVGGSAALLPFYRLLEDSVAQAASGELPLRFVGVGAYHGTTQRFYARQPGETDTDFDISYSDSCLRPFDQPELYGHSFKDKIIIFEGFDYGVARHYPFTYSNGTIAEVDLPMHGCMGFFLTGSQQGELEYDEGMSHTLQNASLDQYLAGLYGGATPFRSLELKTEANEDITALNLAAGEGGTLLSALTSPEEIWDRFFALLVAADPAALAYKRAVGGSVLDFAINDIQRLQTRLAGTEKQKLDQHLTVLRDLEQQLNADVTCEIPPRHAETGNADQADDYIVGTSHNAGIVDLDRVANMQIELLAQILICDLTRFSTIILPNFAGPITGGPQIPSLDGSYMVTGSIYTDIPVPADFHLEIAHKTSPDVATTLNVHRAAAAVQRYYHGKVARLMQRLQDAGVLDSTVILIGNEGGAGWHTLRQVPIVMAGGANGAFQTGRRIVAPGRIAQPGDYPTLPDGGGATSTLVKPTSHNPILVAVANAFRAAAGDPEIDSYGTCTLNPEFVNGIAGLI